ncbi:MAG: ATP-dependent zinc metalloprotease FtsH [Planctomycetota bacterium]
MERRPSESPPPPEDPKKPEQPPPPRWNQRTWVWFLLFILLLWMVFNWFGDRLGGGTVKVDLNRFIAQIKDGNTKFVEEVEPERFEAELRVPILLPPKGDSVGGERQASKIYTPASREGTDRDLVITTALDHKVPVTTADSGNQFWALALFQILPIFLLIGIFWYMSNRVRKQMGPGIFGRFSGNRAKKYERGTTAVTFEDVAGLKNVKQELTEIVTFLKHPDRFTRLGAKIPKGVLLVGPPGTGKTLLARAVAGEAGVPFYSISGSEFIELFVGVGASRVRELFDEAKKSSPCIVFIDEIDAVGRSRGAGLGGGHDEREQTLNQILSEMDGFESNQAVIVLAATNRPDVLDPALVRPGRFDRQVVVELPQREGRRAILDVHSRDMPRSPDVDLDSLARGTIGFSGADLQNLANEAALLAAREGKEVVTHGDFERAKDKIVLGTLRDEAMGERERQVTAYHEAGHALLAILLPGADPVHSVTIVPRGRALGVTQQLPAEEIHNYSRSYLFNRVVILLGGRAAEELIFDEFTTGAENDLQQSTELVERMICRWGMSEKLGPVSFRRGEEHVFLGRELGERKHFSEHTAMLIDDEVRRVIDNAYQQAFDLLGGERGKLERLASELLEKEILADREIYLILDLPLPESLKEKGERAGGAGEATEDAEGAARPAEGVPSPSDVDPDLLGLEGA